LPSNVNKSLTKRHFWRITKLYPKKFLMHRNIFLSKQILRTLLTTFCLGSLLFIPNSQAASEKSCDKNFWSEQCQQFIRERDLKNNAKQEINGKKQLADKKSRSKNTYHYDKKAEERRNEKQDPDNAPKSQPPEKSPFLERFFKDYSQVKGYSRFLARYFRDYSEREY
jgi:hypothetical protein